MTKLMNNVNEMERKILTGPDIKKDCPAGRGKYF